MYALTRRDLAKTGACAALGLAGCASRPAGDSQGATDTATAATLTVFAAASLTESLTAAGEAYKAEHDVRLVHSFESSGTLKTQIEEGAVCDVFISAGQLQMDQLDAQAAQDHEEGLDFIDHATRFDILENKVVLVVPEGNPKGIAGFDDLSARLGQGEVLLAMGNADVPVGQYTQKILAYYGLDEDELAHAGCISYGTNVKEVCAQVQEAAVDCGVVYQTDAHSAGLAVADDATEQMCGRVVYPAAVLKASSQPEQARAYLDFLRSPVASACFAEVGFTPLAEA